MCRYFRLDGCPYRQLAITKGDGRSLCCAFHDDHRDRRIRRNRCCSSSVRQMHRFQVHSRIALFHTHIRYLLYEDGYERACIRLCARACGEKGVPLE